MKTKTILIADDELHYVNPLRSALEREGYNVVWAQNATEALSQASNKPELLIMDLMRGQSAGFDVCRKLRSMPEAKHLPIIMLTNRNEEADEVIGLELGADEFLNKSVSPRVLSARIKNVLRRYNVRPSDEISYFRLNGFEIDKGSHSVKLGGKEIFLPRKEFELLWILSSSRGKVFSREMLLRRIWGENIYVTDRTVDVHICKVRERLGKFGLENLETIKGVGYRFKA